MKIIRMITAIFLVLGHLSAAITAGSEQVEKNIEYQNERMDFLRNEYYADYTPCDESQFAAFDIDEAIENGVKYNEVQFLGTHNSYQIEATEEYKQLFRTLSDLTFGLISAETAEFTMDSLTEQLEVGIRSLEIDIETVDKEGDVSFIVTHNPQMDNTTGCYDFEKAIEEIKMWSDHNPGHLPVTVIVEPKKGVIPVNDMKNLTMEYVSVLEEIISEKMGDTLLTPKDMMGNYGSFKEMREADGWLRLEDTMGKVLFLLHDTTVTSQYIKQDESIKSQTMFPMLRFDDRNKEYASFIIDNEPGTALSHEAESIEKCNLIVRTRADSFPNADEKRYEKTNNCLSQIISTDYPVRKNESRYPVYSFDGYTVKLQNKI